MTATTRRFLPVPALLLAACLAGEVGGPGGAGGDDDGDDAPAGADAAPPGTPDAAPIDECQAAGVPESGVCQAPGQLAACVGGQVQLTTCPMGGGCFEWDGEARCVDAAACAGVGPDGRCSADVLWRCDGGSVAVSDCAAAGQLCAWASDATGYACVEAAATGARSLRGTVRYQKRLITPDGLAGVESRPVRGARVAVVRDSDSSVLARAITADDGSYVLRYEAAEAAAVHLLVSSTSPSTSRPFQVLRWDDRAHGVAGETLAAAAALTADLEIPSSAGEAQAFNVVDGVVSGHDYSRAIGITEVAPITVYFQYGNGSGSYYDGTLVIAGQTSNSDGYDDMVILHEFGHFFQHRYAVTDNPGGAHDGSPADPRLAWAEGQATYFAMAVSGRVYYADSNASGGWHVELEERVHAANPTGAMSQNISEWMVAELLWDVGDGAADADADPFADGDHARALAVSTGYMKSGPDRGRAGADLVDWLDGWFASFGDAACGAMSTLLAKYGFPYDFADCP